MGDPMDAILRAAGYEIVKPTAAYQARNHTGLVFAALEKIGVGEARLPHFADKVARACMIAGPRDVATENRISAEEIEGAIGDIEAGLRLLEKGLRTVSYARATATPNSGDRIKTLADVDAALIGIIADAVATGIDAGDSLDPKIADSIPEYRANGFRNPWHQVFYLAAERAKQIGEAFPRSSYPARKRDRSVWLGKLICELATIYEEATGKAPKISNPSEKAKRGWRSPFARFVEDLWGYLDVTDGPCPGDDKIKGILAVRRDA